MRVGFNPQKDRLLEPSPYFHQVVLPVYLPHADGYFKDGLRILQLCLTSLFRTMHDGTYVTVVNNGSSAEVREYLEARRAAGQIHEVVHTTNIGYINAMLKGVSGHRFPLLTTADSDVLFLNGWQEATYRVFRAFPKAGAVSPVPNSRMLRVMTANLLCERGLATSLRFGPVDDPEAMRAFAASIDRPDLYREVHLRRCLRIRENGEDAVVGAGHFVVTYRADLFARLPRSTPYVMGGDSDDLFDRPVAEQGFWRLATPGSYALHMGNTLEPWMTARVDSVADEGRPSSLAPALHRPRRWPFVDRFHLRVTSRVLFKGPVWRRFLRFKGLTREDAAQY